MDILDDYQTSYARLNRDLHRLSQWAAKWLVTFNADKTVFLQVTRKLNPAPKPILNLNGIQIREVNTHKHLGLTFNSNLTWSDHIGDLATKAGRCVGLLRKISREVPRECLEILYKAMIRPIIEYAGVIFDGSADQHLNRLESVQRQAALACTGAYKHTTHEKLLEELGWPPLSDRRRHHRLNLMYRIQTRQTPNYLTALCPPLTRDRTTYDLRSAMDITTPQQRTATYHKSFFPKTISDWNDLDCIYREVPSLNSFKEYQKKNSGYKVNRLYHHNTNTAAINQTRMRLGLSGLGSQRYDYNHINDPRCLTCGAKSEDPSHYFLTCPTYAVPRIPLLREVCDIFDANNFEIDFRRQRFRNFFTQTLLKGTKCLNAQTNEKIFSITQTFIRDSHRFP